MRQSVVFVVIVWLSSGEESPALIVVTILMSCLALPCAKQKLLMHKK